MMGDEAPRSTRGSGVPANTGPFDILLIGSSFGGPRAVEQILRQLPQGFGLPIVLCQHITPGMTAIWAQSLTVRSGHTVGEAENRAVLEPGKVYVAPAGLQMRVTKGPLGPQARLDADFADSLHVPSIDVLFSSAAHSFGSGTIAVLLTGLGRDGTSGMVRVREAGGHTIGEAESTAASYSMPGSAAEAGGVVQQLPLDRIAPRLVELAARRR